MVRIRRFNPSNDLIEIAKLANNVLGEDYRLSMFTNVFDSWPDGFLIAESMDTYMGTIIGILTEPETTRVLVLAVDEPYRRSGLGGKLLNFFIKQAVLRGVSRITLEVRMSNIGAINFYQKHGFKIVSTIPVYYKDGEGAYVMERYV